MIQSATLLLVLLLTICIQIDGCKSKSLDRRSGTTQQNSPNDPSNSNISNPGPQTVITQGKKDISVSQVSFLRSDEKDSGVLKFNTDIPVNCDLEYWTEATKTSPEKLDCTGEKTTSRSQNIKDLDPKSSLTIKVYIWSGDSRSDVGNFFVEEELKEEKIHKSDKLSIMRVIVPQYTTETYSHQLPEPLTLEEIRKKLSPVVGCRKGTIPIENPFGQLKKPIEISSLSSQGFAYGVANKNPNDQNRLNQVFNFIQTNLNWDWAFMHANKNYRFSSRPPAFFSSFKVISGQKETKLSKDSRRLTTSLASIAYEEGGLNFEWKTRNRTSASFISLEIRDDGDHSIYCTFSSKNGKASIKEEMLADLPVGTYHITAIFESSQVFVRKDTDFPTWVISSQDWRYAEFNKL